MAPLFASPPILTLPSLTDHLPSEQFFSFGNGLWLCAFDANAPVRSSIGKSTDSGANWTLMDDADSWQDTSGQFYYLQDQTGADVIHIFLRDSSAPHHLLYRPFNMTTGLYGGIVDSSVAVGVSVQAVQRSNGDIVVFSGDTSSPRQVQYFILSGGAFSGPTPLLAVGGFNLACAVASIDSADLSTLGINQSLAMAPFTVSQWEISLDATNVIGAPVEITSGGLPPANQYAYGRGLIFQNKIIFPAVKGAGASVGLWIGSPAGSPSWTWVDIGAPLGANWFFGDCSAFIGQDGKLYLFFAANFDDGINPQDWNVDFVQSPDGISFSSPTVYWDVNANPAFPGLPNDDYDAEAPLAIITNKQFMVVAQSEIDGDENSAFVFLPAGQTKRCLI